MGLGWGGVRVEGGQRKRGEERKNTGRTLRGVNKQHFPLTLLYLFRNLFLIKCLDCDMLACELLSG